ncbi:hypothetical protein ACIRRA_43700 [Nocardia sp. NPDC101769]|uniref:hypothetical protein n=1 Tax=Nocardia sp. NPDC101769 TaxID=3364333 RepID=UPI0038265739
MAIIWSEAADLELLMERLGVDCHRRGTAVLPVVGPATAAQKWNGLSHCRSVDAALLNDRYAA